MKVGDFLGEVGDLLQEDFVVAPLWTKVELVGYLKQVLKEFSIRTGLVDKCQIRVVNATTGEASVPKDFSRLYYTLFNQVHLDLVNTGTLDFVDSDWIIGGTADTPLVASLFGNGPHGVVRFVPVPSTVTGATGSGSISTLTLADSSSVVWTASCSTAGVLTTSVAGTAGLTIVLGGPSTFWDLSISTTGVLTTTASASSTANIVYLADSNGVVWTVTTNDLGAIRTTNSVLGLCVHVKLDDVDQTFTMGTNSTNANYGVVVDAYATGVSIAPTATIRLDGPFGVSVINRTSDSSAMLWYKGEVFPVSSVDSELLVSTAFHPVIKHGLLALAYASDNEGRDVDKAKLLRSVFEAECDIIKRMFSRK